MAKGKNHLYRQKTGMLDTGQLLLDCTSNTCVCHLCASEADTIYHSCMLTLPMVLLCSKHYIMTFIKGSKLSGREYDMFLIEVILY